MLSLPRLDPKHDLVFKLLLTSSEDILVALLSAVLKPEIPIRRATVLNPELPQSFPDDKRSILDVLVLLDDGTRIDVEMQCAKKPTLRDRALYYWAQLFSSQLESGQGYEKLTRVVSILFLDYRELSCPAFHEIFSIRGEHTGERFSPLLELHVIELPRLPPETTLDPLVRWGRFLVSRDPAELDRLTREDPMIGKAQEKLFELSADEKLRQRILEERRREVAHRIIKGAELAEARSEGLTQGKAEAILQLLELRGLTASSEIQARVLGCSDVKELDRLLARALTVADANELFDPGAP